VLFSRQRKWRAVAFFPCLTPPSMTSAFPSFLHPRNLINPSPFKSSPPLSKWGECSFFPDVVMGIPRLPSFSLPLRSLSYHSPLENKAFPNRGPSRNDWTRLSHYTLSSLFPLRSGFPFRSREHPPPRNNSLLSLVITDFLTENGYIAHFLAVPFFPIESFHPLSTMRINSPALPFPPPHR